MVVGWLIWLDDGEPLLALPSASHSSALDLLFADELHRSSFDQLPSLKRREPSALEQRCLRLLTSGSAVQWQPSGLASISGSLFPALASVSHGCLRVALQGDRLMAEGPVASSPFASLQAHHVKHQAAFVRFDPPSTYLELSSVSLLPLLGSSETNGPIATSSSSTTGSIGSVGVARTGLAAAAGKAPQLELEMTALPKQQQPGWLLLQVEVR